jgi:uncharacterized protein YdhG (YjbR/CyaY superfamily)
MKPFRAGIQIIGVNPYVSVPADRLVTLFKRAAKTRGPIAVCGQLDGHAFRQTLVKYAGAWRLYLNTPMRRAATKGVGDRVTVDLDFDPKPRLVPMPPMFKRALATNPAAKAVFEAMAPSRRKEILRYLASLKTEVSVRRNVDIVMGHLHGHQPKGLSALMRVRRRGQGSRDQSAIQASKEKSLMSGRPKTIDEYLAPLSGEKLAVLSKLRNTIRSIVPKAEECISYRIPAFRLDGVVVAGFCATAKGCSYFPFSGSTLKALADDLRAYSQTKSSLHFHPDKPLPAALVRKLIKARVAERGGSK